MKNILKAPRCEGVKKIKLYVIIEEWRKIKKGNFRFELHEHFTAEIQISKF